MHQKIRFGGCGMSNARREPGGDCSKASRKAKVDVRAVSWEFREGCGSTQPETVVDKNTARSVRTRSGYWAKNALYHMNQKV